MKHNGKIRTSRWIRKRELLFFMMLPVWLIGLRGLWKECFLPMHKSLMKLWTTNGSLWLTQYLAQVSRAIVLWVGGKRLIQEGSVVRVALTRAGLPLLLPRALRIIFHRLHSDDQSYAWTVIKVTLTVLSVYRVIGCTPNLKLETVTGPFSGICATLPYWEVSEAVRLLPRGLTLAKVSWDYLSESAGPNGKHSTWSLGLDAISFLRDPLTWYHWLVVAWGQGAYVLFTWNLFTIMVSLPLASLLLLGGKFPKYLGRLVTLFEARGKVRIVAITDWWTQVLLRPLHDGLFAILKTLPQDGTFNQMAPVHRLLAYVRASGAKVFSFDLSAATDRLPVLVQVQFLEALGVSWAGAWAQLLTVRPWYLKGAPTFYSVGQPMGALSSWAMLAITHHLLVQVAARRVGYEVWFDHYALLGDDVIIADEAVAKAYHALITDLGVSINMSKSFEMESGLLEFAKRWVHPHLGDLSPMGPGLILACIRNPRLLVVLIQDALSRDYVFPTRVIRDMVGFLSIIRPRKWLDKYLGAILSSVTGPDGGLWGAASGPLFKASWIAQYPHHLQNKLGSLVDLLLQQSILSSEPPLSREAQMDRLVSRFWKSAGLLCGNLWGLISGALVIISPAFWVYYIIAGKAEERIANFVEMSNRLHRTILSSWAHDGLDLRIRTRSLKDFLRVNFDPDLLGWDRQAAEAILTRHSALPGLWEKFFQDRIELNQRMFDAMPELVDPYADFDFDDEDDSDGPSDDLAAQTLELVPLGFWGPCFKQVLHGNRHDRMVAPGSRCPGPSDVQPSARG